MKSSPCATAPIVKILVGALRLRIKSRLSMLMVCGDDDGDDVNGLRMMVSGYDE